MTAEPSRRFPLVASNVPVTDVMARPVVTVDPEIGLLDLMRLFVTAGIGAAPVVDASGTPLGVVSKTDLLRELYDQAGSATRGSLDALPLDALSHESSAEQAGGSVCRARHIMTASPVVVKESASLSHAAGVMAEEHLHRVFVVDERGAITGVLSSSDVVQWLAHEDEDEDGDEVRDENASD